MRPISSRSACSSIARAALLSGVLSFLASTLVAGQAWADDRSLGLSLARDGRCEAALEVLVPLRTQPARDAELERLTGECAIRQKRFDLAADALEAARGLEPGTPGLDLHLAQALYHLGRLEPAEAALERATPRESQAPEFLLYSGLIAFDRGDFARASEQLSAAVALHDETIEPMASFYLGRLRQRGDDRARARESYVEVIEGWSDTAWADQAARSIEAIDEDEKVPVWGSLELGFEADDNALIRGRGVGRPGEVSGQSDVRGYWYADVGALWLRSGSWSGGTSLRYGGSENHELERFDTQAPGATLWLDHALGWQQSSLRLQYDFDAAWIDATHDPFVLSHLVTASLFKPWQNGGFTTLGGSLGYDDYGYKRNKLGVVDIDDEDLANPCPCSPNGVDEIADTNRDGFGPILSVVHRQPLPDPSIGGFTLPWIEGAYRYQFYTTQGREYDHQRHQIELGAGIRLPLAVDFSVRGRYAYVPYANRTVFPDPKDVEDAPPNTAYFLDPSQRREQETSVRVQLQRAFGEHVLVAARWSRTRNRSTADVFDYTRDLFGFSIRIGWGG